MSVRTPSIALSLLLVTLVTLLPGGTTRADDCTGFSLRDIAAGERWVELRHAEGRWQARIALERGAFGPWQALPGLERYAQHGHLNLVQGKSPSAFAVIDSGSEGGEEDKILVYDARGKLLRRWHFRDFMTYGDMRQLRRSISHLQWLAWDNEQLGVAVEGERVSVKLLSGRVLTLRLGAKPTLY